jgi:site-specific recombinase XerD
MHEDSLIRRPLGTPSRFKSSGVQKAEAEYLKARRHTATTEDLRRYQLHLANSGAHPPTINATVSALRFFFSVTLDRAEVSKLLTFVADPRKIPIVFSPEEVVRFLEAAPGPKYKAAQRRLRRPQGPLRDALPTAARAVA